MNRPIFIPLFALLVLLFVPGSIPALENEPIEPSEAHAFVVLEGTIGDSLEVRMFLATDPAREEGEAMTSRVSGWYEYKKIRKPINLWGTIDDEGTMTIDEGGSARNFNDDIVTGHFEGVFNVKGEGGAAYDGTWTSPDGKKRLPFTLAEQYASGIAAIDRYYFSVKYERKRGSGSIERDHSMVLAQVRGDSPAIAKVNAYLRSLAVWHSGNEFAGTDEMDDSTWSEPESAPTLEELELAIDVNKPGDDEMSFDFASTESYDDDFEIVYNSGNLLCVRFYQYSYTGGAHGNQWDSHVTFDLTTGKVVKLDDLFSEGWEEPLTRLVEKAIRRDYDLRADQPLSDGPLFDDDLALNANWFITPAGIGFSYVPYEISAYAYGFIQPVVDREELAPLLKADSILERATTR